jgi:cyanate permease
MNRDPDYDTWYSRLASVSHPQAPRTILQVETCWWILSLLVLARTAIAIQFQSIAALGPLLVEEFEIDYVVLGTLIGLYMLPGVVVALPGGLLGQRFGEKRIALLGLGMMAVGGLGVGFGNDVSALFAGRIISGTGAVLLNVLLAKMLADWFVGRNTSVAMAMLLTSWPVGLGLALVLMAPITAFAGTAGGLLFPALISAAAFVLMLVFYRSPIEVQQQAGSFRLRLSKREWILILMAGMIWMCFNLSLILVIAFGPGMLTAQGHSISSAGQITSLTMWASVPSLILGSILAERTGRTSITIAACFILSVLAITILPMGIAPILFFIILGILLGVPGGLIMKLPILVLKPENRSVGLGIYFACMYGGVAIVPPLAGLLQDISGDAAAPVMLASAIMIAAAGVLWAFAFLQTRLQ